MCKVSLCSPGLSDYVLGTPGPRTMSGILMSSLHPSQAKFSAVIHALQSTQNLSVEVIIIVHTLLNLTWENMDPIHICRLLN